MKIIVGTLVALLLGSALASSEAEARCWWNGYNHCRYYNHGYYRHGHYDRGWHHGWYREGHWYR